MATYEQNRMPDQELFTRRDILMGTLGIAAGSVFNAIESTSASPIEKYEPVEPTFVSRIYEIEARIGDKELNMEDAEELLPLYTALYIGAINPELSAEDIMSNTFIIRKAAENLDEDRDTTEIKVNDDGSIRSRTVADFIQRYPNTQITKDLAEEIVRSSFLNTPNLGFTSVKDGIHVHLDNINTKYAENEDREDTHLFTFDAIDNEVVCAPTTPVACFRSTFLHEVAHFDVKQTSKSDTISGFTYPTIPYVEEMYAGYISAAVNTEYGFEYATGYSHEPHDFKNFATMMSASGISTERLAYLHRYSMLDMLMMDLAMSAEVRYDSSIDLTRTAQDIFGLFFPFDRNSPNWKGLKRYFSDIDDSHYYYDTDNADASLAEGCSLMPR